MPKQDFSAEEELLLLLCGTCDRRDLTEPRILALAERASYEALAALMARQLLLSIAGPRLVRIAPDSVTPAFRAQVEAASALARRQGLVLETLAEQVRIDLDDAGIKALPLKGAALSRDLYGDPGLRPAKDIDVLVERGRIDEAAAVLERRGYRPAGKSEDTGRGRLHLALLHERPELPPVEIHWRVHWYEDAFSERMLHRSARVDGRLRAQPADELASLLLFYARDGLAGLRLAADIATWWDRHGACSEPPLLDCVAAEAPSLRGALAAAAIALEPLVGVPTRSLLSEPRRSRRVLTATRLANWTVSGEWDQVGANLTLVDFLLSPPADGWSFLRRSLLPPGQSISSMYRLPPSARWRRLFWRCAHAPKLTVRYLIALWRVRGRRRWVSLPMSVRDLGAQA